MTRSGLWFGPILFQNTATRSGNNGYSLVVQDNPTILVTGGAGFIGSMVVRYFLTVGDATVVNVDNLTYAGNTESLTDVMDSPAHVFAQEDICNAAAVRTLFREYQPDAVVHLAAESHVDRSIDGPDDFLRTNILGTGQLLMAALEYWRSLAGTRRERFRFLHVSTDEVYGDLGAIAGQFTESTPYAPNSPYAATKASADHLVRAWHHTYGLPVLVTNCSNNYGPFQFPEKLIPHMIINALKGRELPIYGDGSQVRDWLYVEDHARALWTVLHQGQVGETYNIGGHNEQTNLDVVHRICAILQEQAPESAPAGGHYEDLITYVHDRPGHDTRYAINASKIEQELGWRPRETFHTGLAKTVRWYLDHPSWWQRVLDGSYRLERIGLSKEAP